MNSKYLRYLLTIAMVYSMVAYTAKAEAITITPISVTASSNWGVPGGYYYQDSLIDGSGLTVGGLHGRSAADMWVSAFAAPLPTLDFDLGNSYNLSSTTVWQYNYSCCMDRGVKDFNILGSVDGINYIGMGSSTMAMSPGTDDIAAEIIGLNGTARYIRFDILSDYGSGFGTGLSEVRFDGTLGAPVPEPSTYILFCSGMLGLVWYRRRQAQA